MIYHDKQLVHVHPPKTGGQAIQQALGLDPDKSEYEGIYRHDTLAVMYMKCPQALQYRVAVSVRAPGERLVSFYFYVMFARQLSGDPTKAYLARFEHISDFLLNGDFDYIQTIAEGEGILRPQSYYLDGYTPDIVWHLDDVGPLLPVANRFFKHYTWADVGGEQYESVNLSLWRFLQADAPLVGCW